MRALAIITAIALGTPAHADRWSRAMDRWQGGAWLHYELTGLASDASPDQLILSGARLHGFIGANASIAYHVGVDILLGSTVGGAGFAYDLALYPLGVLVRAGKTTILGFGVGVAGMGAVGTIDDAIAIPLEMTAEVGLGRRLRLLSRTRVQWNAGAAERQSGAESVPFADELDAMLGLRVGRYYDDYGFPSGNGYFVGVNYREQGREQGRGQMVGLTIGYSIDLAMPRRWVDEREPEYDRRGRRRRGVRMPSTQ
jgi:hypothetical protein